MTLSATYARFSATSRTPTRPSTRSRCSSKGNRRVAGQAQELRAHFAHENHRSGRHDEAFGPDSVRVRVRERDGLVDRACHLARVEGVHLTRVDGRPGRAGQWHVDALRGERGQNGEHVAAALVTESPEEEN